MGDLRDSNRVSDKNSLTELLRGDALLSNLWNLFGEICRSLPFRNYEVGPARLQGFEHCFRFTPEFLLQQRESIALRLTEKETQRAACSRRL